MLKTVLENIGSGGHICTQHYLLVIGWPEAAMATCNLLLTSIISMSNYTFIVCIVCDL